MAMNERTAYPYFAHNTAAQELAQLYTPTLRELDLARRITRGRGSQHLAFLVMLKSFQRLGYFPKTDEVPEAAISYIGSCLSLSLKTYPIPPLRSRQRYRDAIRDYLQVKAYGHEARRVAMEAVADAAASMDDPADLINVAIEELVKERFEFPTFSTLDSMTRHVRYTVHSDTQGQSAPVFGLSYMLGIHLMPRIRNLKDLIFFRPDKDTTYEHIDSLFDAAIDGKLIETHWRDLMRVGLSIKQGKVLPSTLLRKLGNYSRKNRLYPAFREVGRVIRTAFLLRYLSSQDLRRQITAATNKAESYSGAHNH